MWRDLYYKGNYVPSRYLNKFILGYKNNNNEFNPARIYGVAFFHQNSILFGSHHLFYSPSIGAVTHLTARDWDIVRFIQ